MKRFTNWSWLFLLLAFIFALPVLLIAGNPVWKIVGLNDLYSAGGHMSSTTDGQRGAMASAGMSAAATAAAASARSPMTSIPRGSSSSSSEGSKGSGSKNKIKTFGEGSSSSTSTSGDKSNSETNARTWFGGRL